MFDTPPAESNTIYEPRELSEAEELSLLLARRRGALILFGPWSQGYTRSARSSGANNIPSLRRWLSLLQNLEQ